MSNQTYSSNNINLEFLRKEAKSLLKRCRSMNIDALRRIRAELPRLAELSDDRASLEIRLADVHHALARERGFGSWGELKQYNDPAIALPDFSQPGADGTLPEGFTPWRWGVSYTVRPEMLSALLRGHEYKISVSVLDKDPAGEKFTDYRALYERAAAIAELRIAALPRPGAGMFLHTRIMAQGWFRHANTSLFRAFMTIGVTVLKDGEHGPKGKETPTAEALQGPGGETPENHTPQTAETNRRLEEVVSEFRDDSEKNIFLVSYGEYVPECAAVNYKPFIERAERLAKLHCRFLTVSPSIIRREWFCATHPDIAVVHIYLRL